ncbi:MAG TPA: YiiD C-terminal domain-containing protein [Candidatus Dormibacteraeota bacterium]|nr:YiiD C-terminal domain-containing protein [Candidatus Dormibacteraeota bacterium]
MREPYEVQSVVQEQASVAEMIRHGIEQMPYNAMVGVRILEMDGGRARGSLAARPEVGNHVGTMHAGAQFSLVEAVSGAAVSSAFLDLLGRAVPLAQGAELTYRRPARSDVVAEASIAPEEIARVRGELDASGRARFDVRVTVTDAQGTLATEATMRWYIKVQS